MSPHNPPVVSILFYADLIEWLQRKLKTCKIILTSQASKITAYRQLKTGLFKTDQFWLPHVLQA